MGNEMSLEEYVSRKQLLAKRLSTNAMPITTSKLKKSILKCLPLGLWASAYPVQSRQVVSRRSYSSCSPYDCLLSIMHNCWTRLASGNAKHLSQPVLLHHCIALKHRSSNY
eukprot:jgi/Botrbrau1/23386/Bobra.0051s0034.1